MDLEYAEQVRLAELSQQGDMCVRSNDSEGDLAEALEMRIAYNLDHSDGRTVERLGGRDERVRSIEQPYRKGSRAPHAAPVSEPAPVESEPVSEPVPELPSEEDPTSEATAEAANIKKGK